MHGTAVAIGGAGVIFVGAPGSGKSDLALRLVDRGAVLIADDYVEVTAMDGQLRCSPPDAIAGRIEVRGVGIAALPFVRDVPLAIIIDLDGNVARLPETATRQIEGVEIRTLAIRAFEASAAFKIELALSAALIALD